VARVDIESQLATHLDPKLVGELMAAHSEVKRNYYLGGLRLSAVEGGRFCEAAFRILQLVTEGQFTPLNRTLPSTDSLLAKFANMDSTRFGDSLRLHIPRSLRLVYDIRNKRDTAHLSDGIDPNLQDATLVVGVVDWVLAELVRIYHDVPPDEAQRLVEETVHRVAPVVQDFGGFLKVLNPKLPAGHMCLVLLYQCGTQGAALAQLKSWVPPRMRANLKRTLDSLVHDKALLHFDGSKYQITRAGELQVEAHKLIQPQAS
jgi:hypothetical protein